MTSVICEVGPGVIRLVDAGTGTEVGRARRQLADELLSAHDQPLLLLDEHAVSVPQVWRDTVAALLVDVPATRLIAVYPSGWPPAQQAAVTGLITAKPPGYPVISYSRGQLHDPAGNFVEIGTESVLVGTAAPCLVSRGQPVDAVVAEVIGHLGAAVPVSLDAPAGVPGGADLAGILSVRLREVGRSVTLFDDRALAAAVRRRLPALTPSDTAPAAPTRGRLPVMAGATLCVILTVAAIATAPPDPARRDPATTDIVEGRMTVRIPADWNVRRLTGGPGSDRLQISDPTGSGAVLHLTQSRVPTDNLTATATDLRIALAGADPAVFVAFNAADQRAGRAAVTYREVRPGHDIEWTVVVDNGTRISIGCQSAPGRAAAVTAVCEQAITSARGIRR